MSVITSFLKNNIYFLFVLIAFTSCAQHAQVSYIPAKEVSLNGMQENILSFVNQHRAEIGLSPLKITDAASTEATKHSKDMAAKTTPFGHEGFEQRIDNITKQTGRASSAAENVAYGELTAKEVVDGWLRSPGHKKNIEGNYNFTGIGVAKNAEGIVFFTQIFLLK